MSSAKLEEYIKSELARGVYRNDLEAVLVKEGWKEKEIKNVFAKLEPSQISGNDLYISNSTKKDTSALQKRPKIPKALLLIVLALLIIGIGAVIVLRGKSESPQSLVAQMISVMSTYDSYAHEGELSFTSDSSLVTYETEDPALLPPINKVDIVFSGDVSGLNQENQSHKIRFDINTERFHIGEAELIFLEDQSIFVKIYDLGIFESFGLNSLSNIWIRINNSQITESSRDTISKIALEFMKIQDESMAMFSDLKTTGQEIINGEDTIIVSYIVDQIDLQSLLESYFEKNKDLFFENDEEMVKTTQKLSNLPENIDSISGLMWIDKDEHLLRKISLKITGQDEDGGGIDLEIVTILDKFGQISPQSNPEVFREANDVVRYIQDQFEVQRQIIEEAVDNEINQQGSTDDVSLETTDEVFVPFGL